MDKVVSGYVPVSMLISSKAELKWGLFSPSSFSSSRQPPSFFLCTAFLSHPFYLCISLPIQPTCFILFVEMGRECNGAAFLNEERVMLEGSALGTLFCLRLRSFPLGEFKGHWWPVPWKSHSSPLSSSPRLSLGQMLLRDGRLGGAWPIAVAAALLSWRVCRVLSPSMKTFTAGRQVPNSKTGWPLKFPGACFWCDKGHLRRI